MRTVENSDYFKQLLKSQYERIRKKAYTIVGSKSGKMPVMPLINL